MFSITKFKSVVSSLALSFALLTSCASGNVLTKEQAKIVDVENISTIKKLSQVERENIIKKLININGRLDGLSQIDFKKIMDLLEYARIDNMGINNERKNFTAIMNEVWKHIIEITNALEKIESLGINVDKERKKLEELKENVSELEELFLFSEPMDI